MTSGHTVIPRPPVGRLNGIAGDVGAIVGPSTAGEWFVVVDQDAAGVTVAYAYQEDLTDAANHAPRSIVELRAHLRRQVVKQ